MQDEKGVIFEWCIIGNIVEKHTYGTEKEIRVGSKHFAPNAKVYCLPQYGGLGHENMPVVGLHRKSKRLIKVVMETKWIKNFRVKAVYNPTILPYIQECYYYIRWNNNLEDMKAFAQGLAYHTDEYLEE